MDLAEELERNRVIAGTSRTYASRIRKMKAYFREKFPDDIGPDGELLVPMDVDHVLSFFGSISRWQEGERGGVPGQLKSVSHMGGHRSALVDYYKIVHKRKFEPELDTRLSALLSGFKRQVAQAKQDGVIKITEGKQPLTFAGYRLLSEILFKLPNSTISTFAWPFLILCWCLMARSNSVANILFQHVSWETDSLIIQFAQHKGDKEGQVKFGRHVYANPREPTICPILSIAVLIFSKNRRAAGGRQRLFEGDRPESRFSDILLSVVDNLSDGEQIILGVDKKDIGTHSSRKGCPTYLLSLVDGPDPVKVYLRAGWSLGNVQDRYIFEGFVQIEN